MPRVSYHPDDSYRGGYDVPEGLAEITGAKALIHQFPPNKETGEQQDAMTKAAIEFQPLDKDGHPDGDVVEQLYKFGKTSQVLPENEDGDGPVENETGAEGPAFWADEDWKPNNKTQWMVFSERLIKCGFNEGRVRGGDLSELVGTVGEIKHEQMTGNIGGMDTKWSVSVFKTISQFPYDSKKSAKSKTKAKSSATTTADTDADKDSDSGDAGGGGSDAVDVDEKATEVLMQVIRAQDKKTVSIAAVRRDMMGVLMDEKMKMPQIKPITKKLDDEAFMAEAGELCGFEVKGKNLVLAED